MPFNLTGKYWRIYELEKKFNIPANVLYPVLNSMQGIIRIGYAYLVPDKLLNEISEKLAKKKTYTISTTARLANVSPDFIKQLITNGLQHVVYGIDEIRIEKKYIPLILKAIEIVQNKNVDKRLRAMEIVKTISKMQEKKN